MGKSAAFRWQEMALNIKSYTYVLHIYICIFLYTYAHIPYIFLIKRVRSVAEFLVHFIVSSPSTPATYR